MQVCERAGINAKYLSCIERATSIPSLEVIMKLALALDTTPDEFLTGSIRYERDEWRDIAARNIISSLRSAVGDNIRVFKTEIPRSVRAAEAAENGKRIFKHDRRGKVAEAYTALSKEVNEIGREAYRSRSDGAR